jgi:HEAT repeat protein
MFGSPNVEQMKTKRDVPGLIKALTHKDGSVRKTAVEALGEIRDPRGVGPLKDVLKTDEWYVRHAAAKALTKLKWRPGKDELGAFYWIVEEKWDQCVAMGPRAVEALIEVLKSTPKTVYDQTLRAGTIDALGAIGDPRAVEPLTAELGSQNENVRITVVMTLGKIGDSSAVLVLIASLKDGNYAVRRAAALALGAIGDPQAIEPLLAALKAWDYEMGAIAASALVKIGIPAIEPLLSASKESHWQVNHSIKILDQLGWRPDKDEAGASYWIARGKWDECVSIGTPAVEPLIRALKGGTIGAAEALGKIGDPRAAGPLIEALEKRDEEMRRVAIDALVRIGSPAVNGLKERLNYRISFTGYQSVCQAFIKALGEIGDPPAIEPLLPVLGNEDEDLRRSAAEALDGLGCHPGNDETGASYWVAKQEWKKCIAIGPAAIKPLISVLHDKNKYVRQGAAESLISLYHSKQVDKAGRRLILEKKEVITHPHTDGETGCTGFRSHEDTGIGLEFPL